MSDRTNVARAIGLATGLIGWSFVGPRIPTRWRVLAQAAGGGLLILATGAGRATGGLRPPRLWSGLRVGFTAAAAVVAAIAASTAIPAVRVAMSAREPPQSPAGWLALHIPLGTVWAEEAAFRAALSTVATDAFGPAAGRLLQAVAFGLSHIADARGAGEPALPTVLATGAAGWLLCWLAERSGSLAAPLLVHLAINESGAAAVVMLRRRTQRFGG